MHPILFKIGNFIVPSYGMLIMLGVILCVWLALRRSPKLGLKTDSIYDLAFVALISGFIGARLLFILVNFHNFLEDPFGLIFSRSGFVFLGGLVGAAAATLIYIRVKNLPAWVIADLAAPSLALAHGFGRIGCFAAGCCYGGVIPPDSPWKFLGVRFPAIPDGKGDYLFSWAYLDHVHQHLIEPGTGASAPVYPSQLFESAANFMICAALLLLWRRRKFDGQIFVFYLFLYGVARFLLEFLRGDTDRGMWGGLSTSQVLSILLLLTGGILWIALRGRPMKTAPAKPEPTKPKKNKERLGKA